MANISARELQKLCKSIKQTKNAAENLLDGSCETMWMTNTCSLSHGAVDLRTTVSIIRNKRGLC